MDFVIWVKIAIDQGDDYTTSCSLDYNYFNKYYKKIAIDLTLICGEGVVLFYLLVFR